MSDGPRAMLPTDDPELRRHAATIRDCISRLDALESANRTARRILGGATIGMLALATLFGWSLWTSLRRQVTPEGLEAALQTKVESLAPPLGEKIVEQVFSALPAYRDLATQRAVKVWPAFSARVADEAESFATDTEAMVRARSQRGLERVAARLSEDLKRDFPRLTSKRVEALSLRLKDILLEEGAGLGAEVETTIRQERERLGAMLARLPVDDAAAEPEIRLQKRFLHNLLLELDGMVNDWPEQDPPRTTAEEDLAPEGPRSAPARPADPASPDSPPPPNE